MPQRGKRAGPPKVAPNVDWSPEEAGKRRVPALKLEVLGIAVGND